IERLLRAVVSLDIMFVVQNNSIDEASNPQTELEIRPRRRDAAYLQTQLQSAQKEEAGIQLQAEEFDLMAATADLVKLRKLMHTLF
nr:hypothetical protein [Tanacetum cinerariifolium]